MNFTWDTAEPKEKVRNAAQVAYLFGTLNILWYIGIRFLFPNPEAGGSDNTLLIGGALLFVLGYFIGKQKLWAAAAAALFLAADTIALIFLSETIDYLWLVLKIICIAILLRGILALKEMKEA